MIDVALIMGCSSDFDAARAQIFHEKGRNSIAVMHQPNNFNGEGSSDYSRIISLDLSNVESVKAAVNKVTGLSKSANFPAGNAGVGVVSRFGIISAEVIRR